MMCFGGRHFDGECVGMCEIFLTKNDVDISCDETCVWTKEHLHISKVINGFISSVARNKCNYCKGERL